jgi:hypothetical protein
MDWFKSFFEVYIKKQTYLNLVYLLLAFPLGLSYFIFLITGLSVGLGLLIIWVGILILLLVYAVWYGMLALERILAIYLLNEAIPPMIKRDLSGKSLWEKLAATLTSSVTWKGLFFLFLKFPLGLVSFVALTVFGSISAALLAAPLYYNTFSPEIDFTFENVPVQSFWLIDSLPEAMTACFVGFLLLTASLHLFNAMAKVSGKIAYGLLGDFSKEEGREETAVTVVDAATSVVESTPEPPSADVEPQILTDEPEIPDSESKE